jgi:methyl-accepting chemotaxis protein
VKNLRIGPRIYLIVGILLITGMVAIGIAYQGMTEIRATYNRAYTDRAPVSRVLENIRSTFPDMNLQIWTMLVPDMPKTFVSQQASDTVGMRASMQGFIADWEKNAVKGASSAEQAKFKELTAAMQPWFTALDDYSAHMKNWAATGNAADRKAAFDSNNDGAVDKTTKAVQGVLADMVKINATENAKALAEAEAEQRSAMTRLVLVVGLLTLAGVVFAIAISASITRPLKGAVRFAEAVAHGDYTARVAEHTGGETGELTKAVEEMKESLVGRVEQLHEVAAVVELAADGVSDTAGDVIDAARASGDADLVSKGERLAKQAGNLKGALSAFGSDGASQKATAA